MTTDRQMQEQPNGSWLVWCRKHGKRHTKTSVANKAEALFWWREHTGSPRGPAACPQRVLAPAPNPFA